MTNYMMRNKVKMTKPNSPIHEQLIEETPKASTNRFDETELLVEDTPNQIMETLKDKNKLEEKEDDKSDSSASLEDSDSSNSEDNKKFYVEKTQIDSAAVKTSDT